jgi:TatD DNase family protein
VLFLDHAEMLRSDKHERLVRSLPADRLLTETDGPFVALGDRPARPGDVRQTVAALAKTVSQPVVEAEALIFQNLGALKRAG